MAQKVTQEVAEVLAVGVGAVHVSQAAAEVVLAGASVSKVTQLATMVLAFGGTPKAAISQMVAEVLVSNTKKNTARAVVMILGG